MFTYLNKEDIPSLPVKKNACKACPFMNEFEGYEAFKEELLQNKTSVKFHSCHTTEINEGLMVTAKHRCKGFELKKEKLFGPEIVEGK